MNERSNLPPPASGMKGMIWPAIPDSQGSALLALLYQLEQTQWWSAERLSEYQFRQVAEMLRHAQATVPYYRDRLAASGWPADRLPDASNWSDLPLLRREDIQGAGKALHSSAIPKSHGNISEVSTSGSTGKPVRLLATGLTGLLWNVGTVRDFLWRRCDFSGTYAAIRFDRTGAAAYPDGEHAPSWGKGFAHTLPTGPAVILSITTPVEKQIEWLRRHQPDYLITHPTNLEALLLHCARDGIRIANLKQVQTISEVLKADVRTLCRDVWGVALSDMYTTQEAGYLALQCPLEAHYHVQSENVILEVLDADDRPCAVGQTGRVVVTQLHNFASPLIRYDIGDYAEVGAPCSCGRGLPVIRHIAGRARSMLVLPSGEQFWPFFGGNKFSQIAPVSQFQLVQKTLESIEVKLVTARPLSAGEEDQLREVIVTQLTHPFSVSFTYVDEIPRSKGGKYEEFRSEVAAPWAAR
ncbi:MAG: hypothetical protein QGH73_19120 [Rhodospirillales bacterium]|nr:hypothetical protein [Rhodospirillales bacterium]